MVPFSCSFTASADATSQNWYCRTRKENSMHLTGKERGSMNPTVSKMRCGARSSPPWSHCSPSAHVWNTCSTPSAQPDQQGNLPCDIAVHYTQSWCVNSPWQEHIWRDTGEEAVNPFPCWGSPCSTSTRELLQLCSGVQNSAPVSTAAQDAALSHLCRCISLSDVRKGTRLVFTELGAQVVSTAAVLSGYMCREILLPLAEIYSPLFPSH